MLLLERESGGRNGVRAKSSRPGETFVQYCPTDAERQCVRVGSRRAGLGRRLEGGWWRVTRIASEPSERAQNVNEAEPGERAGHSRTSAVGEQRRGWDPR